MRRFLYRLLWDDDGPTAVEYAVLLALILMVIIGAIGAMGSETGGLWGDIDTDLNATTFGSGS